MEPIERKRNLLMVAVLSMLVPGLGQVYSGLNRRAMVLYGIGLAVTLLFFLVIYRWFYGFVFYVGFVPVFYLVCLGDAVRLAGLKTGAETVRHIKWYGVVGIIIVHLGMVVPGMWVVSPLKPYRVPSDSMARTLLPGDYFLVDKRYYSDRLPERGDVVVFVLPGNKAIRYVKRVVGLAGDEVKINDSELNINGTPINEPYLNKNSGLSNANKRGKEYGLFTVPDHHIFVLGDNRRQSSDSRTYGAVNMDLLKGKSLFLVWSRQKSRIGLAL
jgi:signal peptidase I